MWDETYRASFLRNQISSMVYDVFPTANFSTANPNSDTFFINGLNRVIAKTAGTIRGDVKGSKHLQSFKQRNISFTKDGKKSIVDFLYFIIACIDDAVGDNSDIGVEVLHYKITDIFNVSLDLIYHVHINGLARQRSGPFSHKYFVENKGFNESCSMYISNVLKFFAMEIVTLCIQAAQDNIRDVDEKIVDLVIFSDGDLFQLVKKYVYLSKKDQDKFSNLRIYNHVSKFLDRHRQPMELKEHERSVFAFLKDM